VSRLLSRHTAQPHQQSAVLTGRRCWLPLRSRCRGRDDLGSILASALHREDCLVTCQSRPAAARSRSVQLLLRQHRSLFSRSDLGTRETTYSLWGFTICRDRTKLDIFAFEIILCFFCTRHGDQASQMINT